MNASVVIIVVRSSSERLRIAEMIPTGIAIASQRTTAPVTRKIVAGRRSKMIARTGLVVLEDSCSRSPSARPANGVKTLSM